MYLNITEIKNSIDKDWALIQKSYKPDAMDERGWECLMAVSNGYVGIKGSIELASLYRDPKTYFAGVFDKPDTREKKKVFGLELYNKAITPGLAETPVFRNIEIYKNGRSIDLLNCRIVDFTRTFDLRRNLVVSDYMLEDFHQHLTKITILFFVSKCDYDYSAQLLEITPVNYSEELIIKFINFQNTRPDCLPRLRDYVSPTTIVKVENHNDIAYMVSEVVETNTQIQLAAKTSGRGETFMEIFDNGIREGFKLEAKQGIVYSFTKQVCFTTSLSKNLNSDSALTLLQRKLANSISLHYKNHVYFWQKAWNNSYVNIECEQDIELGTKWCISNLIQLGILQNNNTSIGATGLHGNGYFGHVFWETELWLIPFYIATEPQSAKNLLLYRYKRLDSARQNAKEMGLQGAKFPWTSTHTGLDVTPPDWAENSKREIHISGAVAYAFWNYLQWTDDQIFFKKYGIEVIVETAKFWASAFTKGTDNLYHLDNIVGPDEYQIKADDNYYTLCIAKWNMLKALECMDSLDKQNSNLFKKIAELTGWNEKLKVELEGISRAIAFPRVRDNVCEQHKGFFDLPDVILDNGQLPKDYSYDCASQMSKQADIVMMHYLFPDEFSDEVKKASYSYYRKRCLNGSSLSPSIYCIMGQRLGLMERSYDDFRLTALQDINNLHLDKNVSDGIHIGCAAGTWLAAVYGFGGVMLSASKLNISPSLPKQINELQFTINYHSRTLKIKVNHSSINIKLSGECLEIYLYGQKVLLDEEREYVKNF
jgi:kojibiose phosphorylase